MRTLQSLKIDLKALSVQPENRKTRRASQALARRIFKRLAKRGRRG